MVAGDVQSVLAGSYLARLHSLPVFDGTEYSLLVAAGVRPSYERYKTGQRIIEVGDTSRRVFFLLSGSVIPVCWSADGRELVFSKIRPGSCFGEISAIDDAPRSLTAYADRLTEVLSVSQAQFMQMLDLFPAFRTKILRLLTSRIRCLSRQVYEVSAMDVDARVRSYLARTAMELGIFHSRVVTSDMPTHAEIAAAVGANREAVSRVMSKLNRTGIIESRRSFFRVVSPDALLGYGPD